MGCIIYFWLLTIKTDFSSNLDPISSLWTPNMFCNCALEVFETLIYIGLLSQYTNAYLLLAWLTSCNGILLNTLNQSHFQLWMLMSSYICPLQISWMLLIYKLNMYFPPSDQLYAVYTRKRIAAKPQICIVAVDWLIFVTMLGTISFL